MDSIIIFMDKLQQIFSNRELATFIWLVIFILGFQLNRAVRKASVAVIKAFFRLTIITTILIALLYSTGIVYLLEISDFWNGSMLKDTIFWFVGSAFIILMDVTKADGENDFFKNILLDNLKLVLVLEFVVNFHDFSLTFELILVPILVFLAILQAVAGIDDKHKIVKSILDWLLAIIGITFSIFSIRDIVNEFSDFARFSTLKSFLLPMILSIAFIPFTYLLAIYVNYEILFKHLSVRLKGNKHLNYAKKRALMVCKVKLSRQKKVMRKVGELYNGSTKDHIRGVIA